MKGNLNMIAMKKLFFICLFSVASIALTAQKKVSFTFITSPQFSWMTSDSKDVRNGMTRLGFAYGVESDVFFNSERYSITTGLTVSSTGGSLTYKIPVSFSDKQLPGGTIVNYYLRYLEIPLAIKLRSKDFNRTRFYAQFGLNNWLNIKNKASTSDRSFNNESINGEIRLFNVGINVGGGIEYDLGNKNAITGGIIYSGSFMDTTINPTVKENTTLNSLRVRLGFVF